MTLDEVNDSCHLVSELIGQGSVSLDRVQFREHLYKDESGTFSGIGMVIVQILPDSCLDNYILLAPLLCQSVLIHQILHNSMAFSDPQPTLVIHDSGYFLHGVYFFILL